MRRPSRRPGRVAGKLRERQIYLPEPVTPEHMSPAKDVDAFIEGAPKKDRPMLRQIRAAIRESAPEAIESISYGMPFYSFPGESGFQARLCYFGLLKTSIVFYTRPEYLTEYRDEVAAHASGKSSLHFRLERPIPVPLITKLVRAAVRRHRKGDR